MNNSLQIKNYSRVDTNINLNQNTTGKLTSEWLKNIRSNNLQAYKDKEIITVVKKTEPVKKGGKD